MRLAAVAVGLSLVAVGARAEGWSAHGCGEAPVQPAYDLSSRAAYNVAVKRANAFNAAARAYSDCVLNAAHAEQTRVSQAAQDRIAEIQTIAVSAQQGIYARLAVQAAAFKAAAARLRRGG